MIHDAAVEVSCDGKNCDEHLEITPDFVYPDLSGKGGHYDTSEHALAKKIRAEGWTVGPDATCFCENCSEDK